MLQNVFLDGNSFGSSHRVEKEAYVADAWFGWAVSLSNVRLAANYIVRTKEFQGQDQADIRGADRFCPGALQHHADARQPGRFGRYETPAPPLHRAVGFVVVRRHGGERTNRGGGCPSARAGFGHSVIGFGSAILSQCSLP